MDENNDKSQGNEYYILCKLLLFLSNFISIIIFNEFYIEFTGRLS